MCLCDRKRKAEDGFCLRIEGGRLYGGRINLTETLIRIIVKNQLRVVYPKEYESEYSQL